MSTPEAKVKDPIKRYLKGQRVWVYWPVQMGMGVAGIPDCVGCYRGTPFGTKPGVFFAIEVKAPGKLQNLSAAQELQIGAITARNGKVFITDNVEQFIVAFETWMQFVDSQ